MTWEGGDMGAWLRVPIERVVTWERGCKVEGLEPSDGQRGSGRGDHHNGTIMKQTRHATETCCREMGMVLTIMNP